MLTDKRLRKDVIKCSYNNDKNSIIQDVKIFSRVPINAKKCAEVLTRILSLLNCGTESLSESESTEIFFGATRLFELDDERLRRLVYLLIKSLSVSETEVFIVTSSLTKDINSPNYVYRANAIRVACYILRGGISSQIERYMKSSLVDVEPYVSSSTLLCCIGMFDKITDIVRRWVGEITTCLSSSSEMVRFHATIMLFLLRANDRQSIRKLISTLLSNSNIGVHVECFIIRFLSLNNCLLEPESISILNTALSNHSDAVKLESIKAIINLFVKTKDDVKRNNKVLSSENGVWNLDFFPYDLNKIVAILRAMVKTGDPLRMYIGMSEINKISQVLPELLNDASKEIELLISNKNKTISSLALIILLKVGGTDTIDNLLAQSNKINGDLKLEVIQVVKELCILYPDKYKVVLNYLAANFRGDSSYKFKNEMVDATIYISSTIKEAQAIGLTNICEFIEDCEYPELNSKMLKFLGDYIPKANKPEEFIRFIFNRLILESSHVRCAAINALDNIAKHLPRLHKPITIVLYTFIHDLDHNYELHEHGHLLYNIYKHQLATESATAGGSTQLEGYISPVEGNASKTANSDVIGYGNTDGINSNGSVILAETDALDCLSDLYSSINTNVNISVVVNMLLNEGLGEVDINDEGLNKLVRYRTRSIDTAKSKSIDHGLPDVDSCEEGGVDMFFDLRPLIGDAQVISKLTLQLTEDEEDYNVNVTIYYMGTFFLFEFVIINTLENQTLENLYIDLDYKNCLNEHNWTVIHKSHLPRLTEDLNKVQLVLKHQLATESATAGGSTQLEGYISPVEGNASKTANSDVIGYGNTDGINSNGSVILAESGNVAEDDVKLLLSLVDSLLFGGIKVSMHYDLRCLTGENYDNESYIINNINMAISLYMIRWDVPDFGKAWNSLESEEETGTFHLHFKSVVDAGNEIVKFLGMSIVSQETNSNLKTVELSGRFLNNFNVLAKATIAQPNSNCLLKLQLRCQQHNISKLILKQLE